MFDVVFVGFLNDDLVLADADEHFVPDLHASHGQFVLVEVDVDVMVLAVFVFRTIALS